MVKIESHKFDRERVAMYMKSNERLLPKFIEIAKTKNYRTAAKVARVCMEKGALTCFQVEPGRIKEHLTLALSALSGLLNIMTRPNEELFLDIHGQSEVRFRADEKERDRYESYGRWTTAFFMALILRGKEALKELYAMDMSRAGSINDEDHNVIALLEFQYFYYAGRNHERTEQLFHEMTTIVKRHFAGTFYLPDVDEWPYPNYFLSYNPVLILKAIEEGNQEEFSRNLLEGLEFHQTYWERSYGLNAGDAPLHDDPRGLISWPLTALAALAYDKGMKVEVESEYIPRYMIENRWE